MMRNFVDVAVGRRLRLLAGQYTLPLLVGAWDGSDTGGLRSAANVNRLASVELARTQSNENIVFMDGTCR